MEYLNRIAAIAHLGELRTLVYETAGEEADAILKARIAFAACREAMDLALITGTVAPDGDTKTITMDDFADGLRVTEERLTKTVSDAAVGLITDEERDRMQDDILVSAGRMAARFAMTMVGGTKDYVDLMEARAAKFKDVTPVVPKVTISFGVAEWGESDMEYVAGELPA